MSDGEPGRMTDPPLSAAKIRFCNNGDEVRRGLRRYDAAHVLSASSNGYTGSADLATVAMAKRIFGEAHRFDPTRLSRPCLLCSASGIFAVCSILIKKYYNEARTHLSLYKDAPIPRAVQTVGRTLAMPVLGGLHHQYFRA
jgi:hypothetical protein